VKDPIIKISPEQLKRAEAEYQQYQSDVGKLAKLNAEAPNPKIRAVVRAIISTSKYQNL